MSNEKLSTEPEICRALGCSMSTLRRRLHTEETNFRQIQSEVIFERACQLLLSSTMTLEQIAYTLGYSEAGSFVELLNGSVEWHPVVGAKRIHPSDSTAQATTYSAGRFDLDFWFSCSFLRHYDENQNPPKLQPLICLMNADGEQSQLS
ncbi:MAG: AraC family transcriptional regulator [Sphingomonadales bacterium]|nr:AraC family transcriptional regulator [Sphingomonadales bacterium]